MNIFEESKKQLSGEDKREIKAIFDSLRSNKSANQLKASIGLIKGKLERLERSDDRYQSALVAITKAVTSEIFYTKKSVSFKAKHAAMIAIAYLCDPNDIIPDADPSRGYIDDVYMFHLALTELKKSSPEIYKSIMQTYLLGLNE